METELLRAHYFYYRRKFPIPFVESILDSLRIKGVERNKLWLVARAENLMALYDFYDIQQYELAFEHFQKMYNLLINFTSGEFPLKKTCLYQMADAYYYFSDFKKAIFYMQESLSQTSPVPEWHSLSINSLNTIGVCYRELKLLDSSDNYLNRAYQKSVHENNRAWIGINSGDLGYNYFLRRQYDKAMPLLKKDIGIAVEFEDWGLASGSLMSLAAINLARNNISKADEQLQQAKQYVFRSGQYSRLETLYPLLSKLYAAKGNGSLSAIYIVSFIYVKDSLAQKFNALQILRGQQKVELEEQKARVDSIISNKKIQLLERNILIVAVVLLMLLSIYIYMQQEKKQLLNREKLKKSEDELRLAAGELDNFTKYIFEKNNFIETLQQQLHKGERDTFQKLRRAPS